MKKLITLVSLLVLAFQISSKAQVSLQPSINAVGLMQKSQLWNLFVINNSIENYTAKINLTLTDRNTGQEVITASTGVFSFGAGTKQLNISVLNPIQYNYLLSTNNNSIQDLIPVGNYNACYTIVLIDQKQTPVTEECVSFDVEALSPPILSFPANESVSKETPTQFSWIPPAPLGLFSNLRYEIVIVPVNEGQNPEEAIQQNLPIYLNPSELNTALNYGAAGPQLEKNKWYAWQVIAKDNFNYAGKSEVFTFKIISDELLKIINIAPFIKLTNQVQSVTTLHQGVLKIEYYHAVAPSEITVTISNENNDAKQKAISIKLKVNSGQNFLIYDISRKIKLDENNIYKAQVINERGESYTIYFKPKKY
jgi:hypothetical protein